MQPLMVFFWRSSCGWMKCPQIRACSGSGAAETKSRRKRDRAAGALGQISGLDQLSCGGGFPDCESLAQPRIRLVCVLAFPGVRARRKESPGSGVFQLSGESSRGYSSRDRRRHVCRGLSWGATRQKRVRVTPGNSAALESTAGGCHRLKTRAAPDCIGGVT